MAKVIQQKDTTMLEANNARLAKEMADLKEEDAQNDEDVRYIRLQFQESLTQIWDVIGYPGNKLNKAQRINNKVGTASQLSAPKVVVVLVEFGRKMVATLVEMRKVLLEFKP